MKISIVTDEISADPETALELAAGWGIRDFELRGIYDTRVPDVSAHQKQRLRELLDRYQARVVAISPGLFKIPFPPRRAEEFPLAWLDKGLYESWAEARRLVDYHMQELLPRSLDYAAELGAPLVLTFGFNRAGRPAGAPPDEALTCLLKAAEQAQAAGLQLAIENEAGFWADTGERTAAIVNTINHPCLGVNWDPGNAFFEGDDPYPAGYGHVRGWVRHVHFKDALRTRAGEARVVEDGQIDWEGQIRALAAGGYSGHISIETHLRPKVGAAKAALARLSHLIDSIPSQTSHSVIQDL